MSNTRKTATIAASMGAMAALVDANKTLAATDVAVAVDGEKKAPEAEQTVALGSNPILADVAMMHEGLGAVRAAIAQASAQVNPNPSPVLAFSIISAGIDVNDQMIVFSPGGDKMRNATLARNRLQAAIYQIDMLIKNGSFKG